MTVKNLVMSFLSRQSMSKRDETTRKISIDHGTTTTMTTTTTTTNILRSTEQQQQGEDGNGDGLIHLPLHSLESILWQEEKGKRKLLPNINGDTRSRGTIRNTIKRNYSYNSEDQAFEENREESTRPSYYNNTRINKKMQQRTMQEITGVATQYVNVYVGTPAQKRTLAISTGADFTAFPCQVNNMCTLH